MNERVLIVDDESDIRWVLNRLLKEKKLDVVEAGDGRRALDLLLNEEFSLALLDINIPEKDGLEVLTELKESGIVTPVIIMTAQSTMQNAIEAMKRGAFDYITKPFDIDEIDLLVDRALEFKGLKREVVSLKERLQERWADETHFVGKSKVVEGLFKTVGRIAPKNVSVILQGESGTGKELLAKLIHMNSPRSNGPFIAVNTAAIPKELMESELFGFVKGAFTGAIETRRGKFELADGGTLFLDEIGDMPIDLQSRLLRAIQEQEYYPIGAKEPLSVDVRIVSATNRDLEKEVANKRFREDLYYRLNVVTIKLPPLRARRDDIPVLAEYFLRKFQGEMGVEVRKLSPKALETLTSHRWPGNVRELENTLRRVVLLSSNPVISMEDLAIHNTIKSRESLEDIIYSRLEEFISRIDSTTRQELYDTILPFMERPLLKLVLKKTGGNQVRAAELLGINRNTLRKKIRGLGIKVRGDN
ncbi:MAG: sigma-54-dependent Fis family transcriptional regulator [Deltaproteobacteria bacterium]|nr:sigma-54-dependent Fis family transcriptional regulator [Deltaproteobacteria bacterium]